MPSQGDASRSKLELKLLGGVRDDCSTEKKHRSIERVAARFPGNTLGFRPRVFPAVVRANRVYGAVLSAIVAGLDERADVRQFAAGSAVNALTAAIRSDRQHGRDGSFRLGGPGVSVLVIHDRQCF